ncbi:hypothetical protein ACWDYH_02510 [Nocardia goodfellowii]
MPANDLTPTCTFTQHHPDGPAPTAAIEVRLLLPACLTASPAEVEVEDRRQLRKMTWFPLCQQCRDRLPAEIAELPGQLSALGFEERALNVAATAARRRPEGAGQPGESSRGPQLPGDYQRPVVVGVAVARAGVEDLPESGRTQVHGEPGRQGERGRS